mmetsp:Transcript_69929/g.191918  ORF Transcript_69929/g.191918 Transcript_69929/m.191918 type:complete len:719 (+) Transcript_69929:565-2721(+)
MVSSLLAPIFALDGHLLVLVFALVRRRDLCRFARPDRLAGGLAQLAHLGVERAVVAHAAHAQLADRGDLPARGGRLAPDLRQHDGRLRARRAPLELVPRQRLGRLLVGVVAAHLGPHDLRERRRPRRQREVERAHLVAQPAQRDVDRVPALVLVGIDDVARVAQRDLAVAARDARCRAVGDARDGHVLRVVDLRHPRAVEAVREARRVEVDDTAAAPPPHLLEPHALDRRRAADRLALAKDGRDARALHAREVHPARVVLLALRIRDGLGDPVGERGARRQRHVERAEEAWPVVDGERRGDVRAQLCAQPRRAVTVEAVELGDADFGEAAQEADVEHEQPVGDDAPLPAPLDELRLGALARPRKLRVVAARPQHAAVHRLAEQRPRELAPAQARRDAEQRHEHAERRLRLLCPRALVPDEALHARARRGAQLRVVARESQQQPVELAVAVEQPVGRRDAAVGEEHGHRADELRQHVERHRRHEAAARVAPRRRVAGQREQRALQLRQRRVKVLGVEVERQEVRERLVPHGAADVVVGVRREAQRVEGRVDAVELVRARVDRERERDAKDFAARPTRAHLAQRRLRVEALQLARVRRELEHEAVLPCAHRRRREGGRGVVLCEERAPQHAVLREPREVAARADEGARVAVVSELLEQDDEAVVAQQREDTRALGAIVARGGGRRVVADDGERRRQRGQRARLGLGGRRGRRRAAVLLVG